MFQKACERCILHMRAYTVYLECICICLNVQNTSFTCFLENFILPRVSGQNTWTHFLPIYSLIADGPPCGEVGPRIRILNFHRFNFVTAELAEFLKECWCDIYDVGCKTRFYKTRYFYFRAITDTKRWRSSTTTASAKRRWSSYFKAIKSGRKCLCLSSGTTFELILEWFESCWTSNPSSSTWINTTRWWTANSTKKTEIKI